jgi:hypothetical protein
MTKPLQKPLPLNLTDRHRMARLKLMKPGWCKEGLVSLSGFLKKAGNNHQVQLYSVRRDR